MELSKKAAALDCGLSIFDSQIKREILMTKDQKTHCIDAGMVMLGKELSRGGVNTDENGKPKFEHGFKIALKEAERHLKSVPYTYEEYEDLVKALEREVRGYIIT